jgi:hypothetical protein
VFVRFLQCKIIVFQPFAKLVCKICTSCVRSCLFNLLSISVWNYRCIYIGFSPILCYSFIAQTVPTILWLLCSSDIFFIIFYNLCGSFIYCFLFWCVWGKNTERDRKTRQIVHHCLAFWHYKMSQGHLLWCFFFPDLKSAISPGIPGSLYWKMVLETNTWALGVLITIVISL